MFKALPLLMFKRKTLNGCSLSVSRMLRPLSLLNTGPNKLSTATIHLPLPYFSIQQIYFIHV